MKMTELAKFTACPDCGHATGIYKAGDHDCTTEGCCDNPDCQCTGLWHDLYEGGDTPNPIWQLEPHVLTQDEADELTGIRARPSSVIGFDFKRVPPKPTSK